MVPARRTPHITTTYHHLLTTPLPLALTPLHTGTPARRPPAVESPSLPHQLPSHLHNQSPITRHPSPTAHRIGASFASSIRADLRAPSELPGQISRYALRIHIRSILVIGIGRMILEFDDSEFHDSRHIDGDWLVHIHTHIHIQYVRPAGLYEPGDGRRDHGEHAHAHLSAYS
ncbi:hypothetical protein CCMSSC00406_0007324 [Pleurotus cornucopiae]|uniref:Uncharacterized protein n=1 Tax=Pleurotus cornucopiae TaxID=5321 RepID=A0ACB7IK43_PLECO|nr:hypothetical protein CCMSSC00406_0007324 [Pleurotus cornucopiae]